MNIADNLQFKKISHKIIIVFAVIVFLTLAVGSSMTNRPQIDEGMFASPAYNLAYRGFFGTTVLETEQSPLTRIEQRTYWVLPLFLLNVAASFKIFGFSLLTMRLVSVFWGLVLLGSCYLIVKKLSQDKLTALLALVLTATDYVVLETASDARMDMMSAALGFAAIAVYLGWRERNLWLAILFSQTLLTANGLTHPNAITAFVGVLFLTFYFDFRRLNWRHFVAFAIPYLVGGAAFGLYVWQDPTAFKDQFIDNALMGGRMSGFNSPLQNIVREFTERYPHAFGLQGNSGGHTGPIYLKSLILITYLTGILGVLSVKELRRNRNYFALLVLAAIYFFIIAIIDGQKETYYLVHIVPFYLMLTAVFLRWIQQRKLVPQIVLIGAAAAFMIIPAGGMAVRIRQNTYGNFYSPMIAFLQSNANSNDLIMGGAELGFGLNFPPNQVSDGRWGFYTGKRPKFIVYDSAVENSWLDSKILFPEFYEYFPKLLNEEYKVAYENDAYKIYERR